VASDGSPMQLDQACSTAGSGIDLASVIKAFEQYRVWRVVVWWALVSQAVMVLAAS
jgi:hypothetical protein